MYCTTNYRAKRIFSIAVTFLFFVISAGYAAVGDSAILSDLESGTNQNNFGAYWYFYDDCSDGGTSVVTSASEFNEAICGEGKYTMAPFAGEGNINGTPGYGVKAVYELGAEQPMSGIYPYGQFVGIGSEVAKRGMTYDMTGATKITYWAKASAAMTVRVEVATSVVTNFAYHRTTHDITTSWAQYEIILIEGAGIDQPDWNEEPVTFDNSKIEKIQWQVSADEGAPASGTLWLDDIVIHGITFKSPDLIAESYLMTAGSAASVAGEMLSDMETAPYNKNSLDYYWYCYNDAEGRSVSIPGEEFSEIIAGANIDAEEPAIPALVIDGNGMNGGNGAYIEFQLGPTFSQGGTVIKPFVGLGTKLSDNLGTVFYDAVTANVTGIYFDYKTTGDVDMLRLEVKANQEFPNTGIVHYVMLPATDGAWQGVQVPFSVLKLPDWQEVEELPPSMRALKTTELEKIQWAFQGNAQAAGSIAVDNVKLLGTNIAVRTPLVGFVQNGISIGHNGGAVIVSLSSGTMAQAQLLDMNGRTRVTAVSGTRMLSINTGTLAGGVYMLQVKDARGVQVFPVSIVK